MRESVHDSMFIKLFVVNSTEGTLLLGYVIGLCKCDIIEFPRAHRLLFWLQLNGL